MSRAFSSFYRLVPLLTSLRSLIDTCHLVYDRSESYLPRHQGIEGTNLDQFCPFHNQLSLTVHQYVYHYLYHKLSLRPLNACTQQNHSLLTYRSFHYEPHAQILPHHMMKMHLWVFAHRFYMTFCLQILFSMGLLELYHLELDSTIYALISNLSNDSWFSFWVQFHALPWVLASLHVLEEVFSQIWTYKLPTLEDESDLIIYTFSYQGSCLVLVVAAL